MGKRVFCVHRHSINHQYHIGGQQKYVAHPTWLWLVSTGGFTQEVLTYVNARTDIYASDYEGINSLFKAYGGNYSIPQFAVND
ncbi:MAG: hypothetical protein DRQ41_02030 [Gammaproteobacteria bacterium]|nr:MAG: hypothetical protein DRQ41_02030 [Gammaproteobacteria bacterium]